MPAPTTAPARLDAARLAAARLFAATRMPYFANALFALRPVATPGLGTFAVDRRWRLYVDPVVLAAWDTPQAGAVLIHETLHLLRDHAGRADTLAVDQRRAPAWNVACDAEINDDLIDAGLALPGDPVTPAGIGQPDGQLAETYYRPRRRRLPAGPDCGSGAHGRPRPGELTDNPTGIDALQAAALRHNTALAVLEAAGKDPAGVPGGIRRWAGAELQGTVDWRRELAALIRTATAAVSGRVDHTFTRRSRRSAAVPHGILPGLAHPVPEIAVICDTSASMSRTDLAAVCAETEALIAGIGLRHRRVTVLAVDAAVQTVARVHRAADIILRGGGTDMGAGLAATTGLRPRPHVVVVLTDGWTPWPDTAPPRVAVIVGLVGNHTAPPDTVPAWAKTVTIPVTRP